MRARPPALEDSAIAKSLIRHWALGVESLSYCPAGGGSYHWTVVDTNGGRHFATADDLTVKPWLGSTRDEVFIGLRSALKTAFTLREAGLGFVVAPLPTEGGHVVIRIDERYS